MPRLTLESSKIYPKAFKSIEDFYPETVQEVARAVEANEWVIVGMAQNPVVKSARKFLDEKQKRYVYLEYGNYFSQWKRRLAIKLWSGWPTYPQVFFKGKLVGGYDDLKANFSEL